MKDQEIDFWTKERDHCIKFMRPKHEMWRRLLNAYRLEFEGIKKKNLKKISRFYPLTRQILASITYNYPKVFFRVEDQNYEFASDILQRTANSALEVMNVMPEVRQASFDALYCYFGWLKVGFNPRGDDMVAPYIANDAMADDMPYVHRCSPFNVFLDPQTPPQSIAYARYIMERILVPLEFIKNDRRYSHRSEIEPVVQESMDDSFALGSDLEYNAMSPEETDGARRDSMVNGKMVEIWEIHDRLHRKKITFAKGVKQPIEEIPHPFLETEAEYQEGIDGQKSLTGNFKYTGGFLLENGFQYIPIRFDNTDDDCYGLPPMAYAEDTQKIIIESIARRDRMLKKNSQRILFGNRAEQEKNAGLEKVMEEATDDTIAWVNDVNNAFREPNFGNIPPDQLGIESDMRHYEEQILQVNQMASSGTRLTATQAALQAGFGQLNREWMQKAVGDAYRAITYNTLRIMGDERFTPANFLINVGQDENEPIYEAVTADLLQVRFKIDIEAGSMQPLIEQMEREDTLALFNMMIGLPEVDRMEAIRSLLRTFRVPNQDKLIGAKSRAEAVQAAQLEHQLIFMGAPPEPTPDQDHAVHVQVHQQIMQDQQYAQLMPQQQEQVQQTVQEHIQMHTQMVEQKATPGGGGGMAGGGGGRVLSMRDRAQGASGDSANEGVADVMSATRSMGQRVSQDAVTNRDQN